MRRRDLILVGQTNSKGQFLISNKEEMNKHFKQWPNSIFTMKIEVEKNMTLSQPLKGYYFKKIVPDMQRGYFIEKGERYTLKQTEEKLRGLSPIMIKEEYNDEKGIWEQDIRTIEELDNQQLVFYIEHLKEIAVKEFGVYIEDPSNYMQ